MKIAPQVGARRLLTIAVTAAAVGLVGCATEPKDAEGLRARLDEEKSRNAQLAATNNDLQASLQKAESMLASSDTGGGGGGSGDLLPPQAKAGECYARVYVEPQYKETTKTVLASAAGEEIEVIPARFDMVEEQVLVREASSELKVVPAKYEIVTERVLVREAREERVPVPAKYETVTERVKVADAYSYWKPGRGPIERIDSMTGEIMCLIEVPAEYKTVSTRKLVQPAGTQARTIPAEYRTIEKRVVREPAKTVEVPIPAVYKTVKVRKMVEPPSERKRVIPAKYQTVTERELVTDGRMEWRPILCETNTTPDVVSRLQRALRTAGYNPGPVDGVLGSQTMNAVQRYQSRNNLPSGKLTMETLRKLGVQG